MIPKSVALIKPKELAELVSKLMLKERWEAKKRCYCVLTGLYVSYILR